MWNKIKAWLLGRLEAALLAEVNKLDVYEPVLADLIRKNADPDQRAQQAIDWVQAQLTSVVNKAFSATWLSSAFFGSVKAAALAEVGNLDNYDAPLADIIRKNVDPDD